MTPEEYIEQNWGEGWLRNQWEAGDVCDALKEYAQSRLKEIMPTNKKIEIWAAGRVNEIDPDKYGYGDLLIEGAKYLKSEIEKRISL